MIYVTSRIMLTIPVSNLRRPSPTASRAPLHAAPSSLTLALRSHPAQERRYSVVCDTSPKTVVVIGNGMVGHRFCERLVEFDADRNYRIVTFCEEPRPAYDRVNLTKYFEHRQADKLALACPDWYADHGVTLHLGDRATEIDRANKIVRSAQGREIPYDVIVLATGSSPFVPALPG